MKNRFGMFSDQEANGVIFWFNLLTGLLTGVLLTASELGQYDFLKLWNF